MSKAIVIKELIPDGIPQPEHFEIAETPEPTQCEEDGQILVKVLKMSADPYLRGYLKPGGIMKAGSVLRGFVAGKVLQSTSPDWKEGDLFGANLEFKTVQLLKVEEIVSIWKLPGLTEDHISVALGALGMPGATAYGGLVDVLRPAKDAGEIIWVSAAAGAVGSIVGQIAKNVYGCVVIGSAGGPEKCKLLKEKFGFDFAIDYKKANGDVDKLEAMVREVAPEGIDMYFENVGGIHFEAAAKLLRKHGRIAVCGGISAYNDKDSPMEKLNVRNMIYNWQRIEGFVAGPWLNGQRGKFHELMPNWIVDEKVKVEETEFEGIEAWPMAFRSLFIGGNTGKVVVSVE